MTSKSPCPDESKLRQIALGQATAAERSTFAEHLERCDGCGTAIDRLLVGDTLLEVMRAQAGSVETPLDAAIECLIGRLNRVIPGSPASTPTSHQTLPEKPARGEWIPPIEFLRPPRRADEIGRLGRYRVLKVLGRGGMGIVFLAEDEPLHRLVALKTMNLKAAGVPAAKERFLREARAVAALEHEYIVTIFQVDEENGVPFLAMQLLKGMTLQERLQRPGGLALREVLRIARQVALALAAAHARGLVHRDIKPANIWLEAAAEMANGSSPGTEFARVKVLDFGLVRSLRDDLGLPPDEGVGGTPFYMAPEQARGEQGDHRCDLFSLGVVLYRMCAGRLPFRGDDISAVLKAVREQPPPPIGDCHEDLPQPLRELVVQLMAKDPAKRPGSAREVADRLKAIERQLASTPPAPGAVPEPPPSPRPAASTGETGPGQRGRGSGWRWGVGGVAAALLTLLACLFAGPVYLLLTNQGKLVVQVDDPDVEVVVTRNGVPVQERTTRRKFVLPAGEGEVEFYQKATGQKLTARPFTLSRGGTQTITVHLDPARPPAGQPQGSGRVPAADRDRQVAEGVLSFGGEVLVRVGDRERQVKAAADLPPEGFQLLGIGLAGNLHLDDPHLEHLKDLTNLVWLNLSFTRVGDAGLVRLEGLPNLTSLALVGTRVSDDGLAHLKALPKLAHLILSNTRVTDAGLAHLKGITGLQVLVLDGTAVSGSGLEHLKDLPALSDLRLGCPALGDSAAPALGRLKRLKRLDLRGTGLTDEGLQPLHALTDLKELDLRGTRMAGDGITAIRKALPNCQVQFGAPAVGDERWAAEWVLARGGKVTVRKEGKEQVVEVAAQLPGGPFRLVRLNLHGNRQVCDAGMDCLKGLPHLEWLDLSQTRVGDAGLERLGILPDLQELLLSGTQVGDAGLVHLGHQPRLTWLQLNGTAVSDAGLAHLKGLANLKGLWMYSTRVSDAGLEHLKALPNLTHLGAISTRVSIAGLERSRILPRLTHLVLGGPQFGDADLEQLKGLSLPNLREFGLTASQVSDAGLEHLKVAPGLTLLDLNHTAVGDAGLERLKALPHLASLGLARTRISDGGLELLRSLPDLKRLYLDDTKVSDAAVEHLSGLSKLEELQVTNTGMSAKGIAALREALPRCRVTALPKD